MNRVLSLVPAAVLSALLLASVPVRGAKPPADLPATVTFRCASSIPACPVGFTPDGIQGDGQTYPAVLNSNRELRLQLLHGSGRVVWLDFRNGPPLCPSGCRRDFDTLFLDDVLIQTNVVDASGAEVVGGLMSIPVGGSSASRLKIAFSRLSPSGQSILWAVRFNPEGYPGSDHLLVRRMSSNTWEVEASYGDRALLVSSVFRKNGTELREAPFYMPFKMTVSQP